MEKINYTLFAFFLILFSHTYGAVNENINEVVSQKELVQLKDSIKKHDFKIQDLKKRLARYESALGAENKKYLSIINERKDIEKNIFELKNVIAVESESLKEKYQKSNNALNGVVLGSLEHEEDATTLLGNKILVTILKKRLFELKMTISENELHKKQLDEFESNYQNFLKTEADYAQVLNNLEEDKRAVVLEYDKELKRKEGIKLNYDRLSAKKYLDSHKKMVNAANKIGIEFSAPIKNFTGLNYKKKKGVSFYFRKMQPVTAPANGKIVFKGSVGSFGKIVFIDHGNDIRSVVLGNYLPKVDKGMFVNKGDIIGYTDHIGNKVGEVYYELREKNRAMNTITLLDKDSLVLKDKK